MKKVLFLLIVPLIFFGLVKKVKADSFGYEVIFESKECYVPIGGNVYEYLPTAYIYDTINEEIETTDGLTYSYDYQGIKFSNIDTTKPNHSFGYMEAYHSDYACTSGLVRIEVYVYDNVAPTVVINSNIDISYRDNFDVNDYLFYTDNATNPCTVSILGNYENHVIGDYELGVRVVDGSNNSTQRDFILHIYDNISPIIECEDTINVNILEEFKKENYIKVYDEYDGILDYEFMDIDTSTINSFNVTITATDSSNNISKKTITINVLDKVKPVIELKENELNIMEDYDFKSNVSSVTDNCDTLSIDDIEITKKLIGTQRYLITYKIKDSSNNECLAYSYANMSYYNLPIIEAINLDNLTDCFDPLYYVKAYDVEDGDLNDKIMVVEMNYAEKYCIYEVYDSDSNVVRKRIDFISEEEKEKYESTNKINIPSDEVIEQNPISNSESVKNVTEYKTNNYNFIYYIVLGLFVLGIIIFILVKHFKKKMV